MKIYHLITILLFSVCQISWAEGKHNQEVSENIRKEEAIKHIDDQTVAVFVKGLICESCAIGVKKKTTRLKFIDKSRFSKGLQVDSKHQLLYLAITENTKVDYSSITIAIKKAGYTPVTFYSKNKGTVSTQVVE